MLSLFVTIGLLLETVLFAGDAFSTYPGPIISTKAGTFQGLELTPLGLQHSVYAFLGIPYAKPPTGPLRFSRPVPAEFISGTFSATTKPPSCFQLESSFSLRLPWVDLNSPMSEDCLYLNIWTPETISAKENLKPVMVWVHGGGFISGSSAMDLYDGQVLSALGQVVVVTFNYRMGPFGFLDTLAEDTSSNVALNDQLLVLKWVQVNIEYFGGDPKSVTLFGESAGAMNLGSLALSPLSRGLFHRLIAQSGSAYAPPERTTSTGPESANLLATLVGCANYTFTLFSNPDQVVSCMRSVPAIELTETYYRQLCNDVEPVIIYYRSQFGDEVIPKNPMDIFLSGKYRPYDILTGVTKVEGSSLFPFFFPDDYIEYAQGDLVINKIYGADLLGRVFRDYYITQSPEAVDYYLKDVDDDEQSILNAIFNGIGDPVISCPTVYSAERYSEKGRRVFFYRFDHMPSTSPWPESFGAAHFEEVQFVFGLPLRYPERYRDGEIVLSEYMVRTWTNFAKSEYVTLKNGYPWPTYSPSKPMFATFQTDGQNVGSGIRKAACEFWRPYFRAWGKKKKRDIFLNAF